MSLAVANIVAVEALPVNAPTNDGAVTVPITCNLDDGVLVPIPTLLPLIAKSPLAY